MRKKTKMSTADCDEINLRKGYCPAAIDDSSRTDPKVVWQYFARCKMTPTCTVNRKITRLRDISGDTEEEVVLKVRKKRRRTGVTTLLPEQLQLRKFCAGQTADMLESGAGDCKKKKKKKRVNKSVKRRRAKEAEVLNITMTRLKNPSGQLVELPMDRTVRSRDSCGIYDESTVTVTVHGAGAGASAALKVHRLTDTDDVVWNQDNNSFLNKCRGGHGRISSLNSLEPDSSQAFPIENYRLLQVTDLISYRTFELCTHTMRPVLSGSKQCRIVACSWDTVTDMEPTSASTSISTSISSSKRPLTLTLNVQDRLLVLMECSCVGGSECGPVSVSVREYWVLGSDMEEIHLLNPDTDRFALITASSSTSTSTVGSEIAFREKAKSVSLKFQILSKSDVTAISQSQLSAVTSLDNDRRNVAEDTGIFDGTFSLSEIGITQQPIIESTSSSIEMLSKGANKKRRKAKAKGKGKEKEKGTGINCLQSQLGSSSVDHSDMQSTPTTSTATHSQSNVMSLSPTLPRVRESILPCQLSYTEAEKSTTECNTPLTKLTDTDPTCQEHFVAAQSSSFLRPPLSPASSNREDEDDYSAAKPTPVAVSFADMFESLLSEKRKLIQ